MEQPARGPRASARRWDPVLLASFDAVVLLVMAFAIPGSPWAPLAYGAGVMLAFTVAGLYRSRLTLRALDDVGRVLAGLGVPFLLTSTLAVLLSEGSMAVRQLAALAAAVVFVRPVAYGLLRSLRRRGILSDRTVIVGAGEVGCELARVLLEHPEQGLTPVGFVDVDEVVPSHAPLPVLGCLADLHGILAAEDVNQVIIAFTQAREADLVKVMRAASMDDVELRVVPRFFDIGLGPQDVSVEDVMGIPLYRIRRAALHQRIWPAKRAFDIVVTASMLLVLAPLLAVLALLVRVTSPGPILFRQERIGQHGRPFELLKFRSMRTDHDGDNTWSVAGSSEHTPVGGFLRRTSLDELPQLLNVLVGDMSLVGPRPERALFVERFGRDIHGYHDRHRLPVGLTGWAQINDLRGDTSIVRRARFDNYYIERWSLWFDTVILLRTFAAVVRQAAGKSVQRRGAQRSAPAPAQRSTPAVAQPSSKPAV